MGVIGEIIFNVCFVVVDLQLKKKSIYMTFLLTFLIKIQMVSQGQPKRPGSSLKIIENPCLNTKLLTYLIANWLLYIFSLIQTLHLSL